MVTITTNEGRKPDLGQTQTQRTCFEQLCSAAWEARMETHGRWPDDGPFEGQPEEVKDWVRDELRGILEAMRRLPLDIVDEMVEAVNVDGGFDRGIIDGMDVQKAHKAMIAAILHGVA